jgi:hypothetical protein
MLLDWEAVLSAVDCAKAPTGAANNKQLMAMTVRFIGGPFSGAVAFPSQIGAKAYVPQYLEWGIWPQ